MIGAASPEEHTFAKEVNTLVAPLSVRVIPFEISTPDKERRYALTVQCGSRRKVLQSDQPFHYDTTDEVVRQIQEWINGARQANRWTTNLEHADAEWLDSFTG